MDSSVVSHASCGLETLSSHDDLDEGLVSSTAKDEKTSWSGMTKAVPMAANSRRWVALMLQDF